MGVHRENTPRKLNKENREDWKKLFIEFKKTELYGRSPSWTIFHVFQDWVSENYESPNKKVICK